MSQHKQYFLEMFKEIIDNEKVDGELDIVKILLSLHNVDPSENDNYILKVACEHGFTEVVR